MNYKNSIIIYESEFGDAKLEVELKDGTVWINRNQMAELFGRDVKTIGKHINNALKEELEGEIGCVANFATQLKKYDPRTGKDRISNVDIRYYSIDVILSVGYRVKSKEGIYFRKWSNKILQEYIVKGYSVNEKRLNELKSTVKILRRTEEILDANQVLDVIETFTNALNTLENYDNQSLKKPSTKVDKTEYLSYEDCIKIIDKMKINVDSNLFGKERDKSFIGAIETIISTFDGIELYPTIEEKAANMLYFLVKDHGLYDGNKRIATTIFLEFLHKNNRLFKDGKKIIDDNTLVAIVIMIAVSNPREKDLMVNLIMNFFVNDNGGEVCG